MALGILYNINNGSIIFKKWIAIIFIGFVILGCLVPLLGFFGCGAISKATRNLLALYLVSGLALVSVEVMLGIIAFALREWTARGDQCDLEPPI